MITKKRIIIFAVIIAVATMAVVGITLAVVFTSERTTVNSGTFSNFHSSARDDHWLVVARSANGRARIDRTLTAEELSNLRVEGAADGGIALRVEQRDSAGAFAMTVDLTGQVSGDIDLQAFDPGRIRLVLEFNHATDVNVTVRWD